MSAQWQRTESSRKLLIDAALQIIGAEGFRALTAARLEAVSGASRGLVNYHFGSKQGLLEAVIRQAHHVVANLPELAVADGANGAEGTRQIVRGYIGMRQNWGDDRGHGVLRVA